MTTLKLDWCSHEAAKYAVEHWHYSRKMPKSKLAKIGVWENAVFVGAVVFGVGANNHSASAVGLQVTEVCELVRVALNKHQTPVSKIVSVAVKMIRREFGALRLILSYADPEQGHHGGIYQAMGWLYAGTSTPQRELLVEGRFMHKRVASLRYGTASPERIKQMTGHRVEYGPVQWKHTYYLPLDDAMRKQIAPLAKPYPKRVTRGQGEIDSAAQSNGQTDGASPI